MTVSRKVRRFPHLLGVPSARDGTGSLDARARHRHRNRRQEARKLFLLDLYSTAVGKKYVMAITGIAMIGFVLAHMIGNLKMYLGPADINHYGEFLRELLVPLAAAHGRAVDPAHRADRRASSCTSTPRTA